MGDWRVYSCRVVCCVDGLCLLACVFWVLDWLARGFVLLLLFVFWGLLVWFVVSQWVCGLLCLVLHWLVGFGFGFLEICSLPGGKWFGVMVYLVD